MSYNIDLSGIGYVKLSDFLYTWNIADIRRALKRHGATFSGQSFYAIVEALVAQYDWPRAFDYVCNAYWDCLSLYPDDVALIVRASLTRRDPRMLLMDDVDYMDPLFLSSGEPTRLGHAFLAWVAKNKAGDGPAAAPRSGLPANSKMLLLYYYLDDVTASNIEPAIDNAPNYGPTEFRRLVSNTIGAIHQLPKLFYGMTGYKYQLKDFETYFGRSSGSSSSPAANLYSCWMRGRESRGHSYGMVLGRCSIRASTAYERHGITLMDILRKNDGLCIANRSLCGAGGVGSTEPGLLYMTFRVAVTGEPLARQMSREEIEQFVRQYKQRIAEHARDADARVEDVAQGVLDNLAEANNVNHFGNGSVVPGIPMKDVKY